MDEIIYSSATNILKAIHNKEVSSEGVVDAHLKRIQEVNPQLNAVVQLRADPARAEAREADAALARGESKGPLHGLPVTIKECIETAGVIWTGGTAGRASYMATQDCPAVARLRNAGAVILGTTNVPELSFAYESDNLVYGRTSNPYDLSRTPGGSTGGESSIIAAGGSPLGLGGDLGGSIRLPAHFCGIAGLRPNPGRVPGTGYYPPGGGIIRLLAQFGPMARYVEDLNLMLPVISGMDWQDTSTVPMPLGDPGKVDLKALRVAFYTDNGIVSPTPETIETVKATAKVLSDAGVAVEEALPPGIEESYDFFFGLLSADGGAGVRSVLEMSGTAEAHPIIEQVLEKMSHNVKSAGEFMGMWYRWDAWRSANLSFMEKYDAVLSPVSASPAMEHGTTAQDWRVFSYLHTSTMTASAGVVVRAGTSPEGLPIGVQLVPAPWREDIALALAQHVETALGGWQWPPI